MTKNVGDKVYKYTLKNEKIFVHEGIIVEDRVRKSVRFEDKKLRVRLPKDEEFGIVQVSGPSLWLTEKDDRLAKRIFIEYLENGISELQETINRRSKLVDLLKEES